MDEEKKWNKAYWLVISIMILTIILFRLIQIKYNHI